MRWLSQPLKPFFKIIFLAHQSRDGLGVHNSINPVISIVCSSSTYSTITLIFLQVEAILFPRCLFLDTRVKNWITLEIIGFEGHNCLEREP